MNISSNPDSEKGIHYKVGETVYTLTTSGVIVPFDYTSVEEGEYSSWQDLATRISEQISTGLGENFDGKIRLQRAVPGKRESANAAILYLLQGEGGIFDVVASLTHDSRGEI